MGQSLRSSKGGSHPCGTARPAAWRRRLACLLALPFLGACASTNSTGERGEPYARAGKLQVEALEDVVLEGAARGKELHVRILVPAADGPFPVIVFSHGTGGSKDQYLPLTERWASHGYVVLQPSHGEPREHGVQADGRTPVREWESRPAEISFLLDSLAGLERREPALDWK